MAPPWGAPRTPLVSFVDKRKIVSVGPEGDAHSLSDARLAPLWPKGTTSDEASEDQVWPWTTSGELPGFSRRLGLASRDRVDSASSRRCRLGQSWCGGAPRSGSAQSTSMSMSMSRPSTSIPMSRPDSSISRPDTSMTLSRGSLIPLRESNWAFERVGSPPRHVGPFWRQSVYIGKSTNLTSLRVAMRRTSCSTHGFSTSARRLEPLIERKNDSQKSCLSEAAEASKRDNRRISLKARMGELDVADAGGGGTGGGLDEDSQQRINELPLSKRRSKRTNTGTLNTAAALDSEACPSVTRTASFSSYVQGGRTPSELLWRQSIDIDALTPFQDELRRMHHVFNCFRDVGDPQVSRAHLGVALEHLGYLGVSRSIVRTVAEEVCRYATLDYKEFQDFVFRFAGQEQRLIREALCNYGRKNSGPSEDDSSDSDSGFECRTWRPRKALTGRGALTKLLAVCWQLGMTATREALRNACSGVGLSNNTSEWVNEIDDDTFNAVLAEYRAAEGFTTAELLAARKTFDDFAKAPEKGGCVYTSEARGSQGEILLGFDQLVPALHDLFGQYADKHIKAVTDSFVSACETGDAGVRRNVGLPFFDFVTWARRVREVELRELLRYFDKHCNDEGTVEVEDLTRLMCQFGLAPLSPAVREFLEAVGCRGGGPLCFDEFCSFVKECRFHQGYSSQEIEELLEIFSSFDYDKSGKIEVLELLDMMRHFGLCVTLDVAYSIVKKVDANVNGSLEFDEMLCFMSQVREHTMQAVKVAYDSARGELDAKAQLPRSKVLDALHILDARWSLPQQSQEANSVDDDKAFVSFETFAGIVDKCQRRSAAEARKRAGFSEDEVLLVKRYFEANLRRTKGRLELRTTSLGGGAADLSARRTHSKRQMFMEAFLLERKVPQQPQQEDEEETIEQGELTFLLMDFGLSMGSAAERRTVYGDVPGAREDAKQAGVPANSVGHAGPGEQVGTVTLWTVLHLLRRLVREKERAAVKAELIAMEKTCFSQKEVAEFREIFLICCNGEALQESESEEDSRHSSKTPFHGRRNSRYKSAEQFSSGPATSLETPRKLTVAELAHSLGSPRPHADCGLLYDKGFGKQALSAATLLRNTSRGERLMLVDVRQLLGCLGLRLLPHQQAELSKRFTELASTPLPIVADTDSGSGVDAKVGEEGRRGRHGGESQDEPAPTPRQPSVGDIGIDFPGFLYLMRWMLDNNFANINGTAEQVLANSRRVRRHSGKERPSLLVVPDSDARRKSLAS